VKQDIDTKFLELKLIFIANRLQYLKKYSSSTIEELSKDFERIKSVEKVIQEVVDCAVDINQYLAENVLNTEIRSSKDSFWKIQKILKKEDEYIKRIIDTVSFRNEIVHSYDVAIKVVWKRRNLGYFVDIYHEYTKDMDKLIADLSKENQTQQ
jgi:uncharacterized protein YutE (UPF0331/DUF86 family)